MFVLFKKGLVKFILRLLRPTLFLVRQRDQRGPLHQQPRDHLLRHGGVLGRLQPVLLHTGLRAADGELH